MANIEELERQIALLSPVEREKLFSKFEREPQTQRDDHECPAPLCEQQE